MGGLNKRDKIKIVLSATGKGARVIMFFQCAIIAMLFSSINAYPSGMVQEVALEKIVSLQSNVFVVRITGFSTVKIKEFAAVADKNDDSFVYQGYYSAEIIDIINKSNQTGRADDSLTMLFSKPERQLIDKVIKKGIEGLQSGDTVFVMDAENLHHTYMYHVQGLRKIVYYYRSADAVKNIEKDSTCILISNAGFSKKNGVLYGNVGYGIFPDTAEMRDKIDAILKTQAH
jgi:hypothetical protein